MVLDGRDKNAIEHILTEHGYSFEENTDGRLLLSEGSATENLKDWLNCWFISDNPQHN
jgi:hypothetical protein